MSIFVSHSNSTWVDEILSNGLNLGGFTLPENVVELILSKVPNEDILNCKLVCHTWKDIVARNSFLKLRFEEKGLNWNSIPDKFKSDSKYRPILHAHLRHGILSKNYVRNSSGQDEFRGWQKIAGDWIVSQEPFGCEPLPTSTFFKRVGQSCFVLKSYKGAKCYCIDLRKEGLTPEILELMLPFKLKFSQLYAASSSTPTMFKWSIVMWNEQKDFRRKYSSPIKILPSGKWQKVEYSFKFGNNARNLKELKGLRQIFLVNEVYTENTSTPDEIQRDPLNVKFARACVTLELLNSEPDESSSQAVSMEGGHD
ncbi:unnamed protein product [Orchesella dallaii]|uniref:F-box domain-containing protein n=1 Tax=Orchesella dallaii TaxID=48710 RepID=A0ABP1RWJ7_9HEXA